MKVSLEKKEKETMAPSKYKVKRLINGDVRLSQDGQLVGDMDRRIWEKHYKPKLVGLEVEYLGF